MTLTQDVPGSLPNPLGSGFSASSVSSGNLYPGRRGSWRPLRTPAFSARPFHPRVLCSDSPHRQAQCLASHALGSSGSIVRVRGCRPAASRVRAQPGGWTRGGSPVLFVCQLSPFGHLHGNVSCLCHTTTSRGFPRNAAGSDPTPQASLGGRENFETCYCLLSSLPTSRAPDEGGQRVGAHRSLRPTGQHAWPSWETVLPLPRLHSGWSQRE